MSKITVLLIEDDDVTRDLYERVISKEGYETYTASDGKKGIELFKKVKPDIVITDKKMPEYDGMEVVHTVKSLSPETEIILITAFGEYETAIMALRHGVLDYLKKPVNLEQLILALGRASKNIIEKKKINIKPSLLVLEDNRETNSNLVRILKKEGYEVFSGSDGEEGIEIFSQNKIDVLLIDIQMPKKDGLQVLKAINNISRDCESVMITGYGDEDTAIEAMRNGAINYIRKPIDLKQLIIFVQGALEKLQLRRAYLYKERELELSEQIIAKITSDKTLAIEIKDHSKAKISNFAIDLIDTIPLSFVMLDQGENILFANKHFVDTFGYTPEIIDEDFVQKTGLGAVGLDKLETYINTVFNKGISELYTENGRNKILLIKASITEGRDRKEGVLAVINK